tara:strand:- start:2328 stop:2468 length:141 start_codon:yes stop_codon:yes gene_type:complete
MPRVSLYHLWARRLIENAGLDADDVSTKTEKQALILILQLMERGGA